jgi:hypothetical protein
MRTVFGLAGLVLLSAFSAGCSRSADGGASAAADAAVRAPQAPRPVSVDAGALATPAVPDRAAAARVFADVIARFCAEDLTAPDLIGWLAPDGVIEAGGVGLPAGRAFVVRNEVVTSLYVGNGPSAPYVQVAWWLNPPSATDPVRELHAVADAGGRILPYADFVTEQRLGKASRTEQPGHPLADLQHHHEYACSAGRRIDLTINEIVWAGDFVGKIGELTLTKRETAAAVADAGTPDAGAGDATTTPPDETPEAGPLEGSADVAMMMGIKLDLLLTYEEASRDVNGSRDTWALDGRSLTYDYEYSGFHPDPDFVRERHARCVLNDEELALLALHIDELDLRRDLTVQPRTREPHELAKFHAELRFAEGRHTYAQLVDGWDAARDSPAYERLHELHGWLDAVRQRALERGACE